MFEFDLSALPSQLATVLNLRGREPLPLKWNANRSKDALAILEGSGDTLFKRCALTDESMAAALRAMLYLWNGLLAECRMHAEAAPAKERLYLQALCERHEGSSEQSKLLCRQIEGHSIYTPLGKAAAGFSLAAPEPPLQRFRGIIELAGEWEPFAFNDLYEQAVAGKLSLAGQEYVRFLQCREFELLFQHCYEKGSGSKIPSKTAAARKPAQRQPAKATRNGAAPAAVQPGQRKAPPAAPPRPGATFRFACPKCRFVITAPVTAAGKAVRCGGCGVPLMTPTPVASA